MIPIVKPFIAPREEMIPQIEKTLYSGYIAEGEKVYEFENRFQKWIGNPYCLSLNSGTAALHIALHLAGIGPNDEVISTPLTAEPTNVAIKLMGAKVVWGDIDVNTGLLSPESVRSLITPQTKAILLVHYAGMVCDMDNFYAISKEFNIPIIEDAAHALGSKYNGLRVGNYSPYTIFSLQAIKHLTTVDGGILAVKTQKDADYVRFKRWFGLDKTKPRLENDIKEPGYKYHMNNVNATIGLVQMNYLDWIVESHVSNGKFYDETLKNISGVDLIPYYDNTEPSYWLYTMKVEKRADFCKMMVDNGVAASELHLRNDRHSIFNESKRDLPGLDTFYGKFVHIPCGWWVTPEDREKIVELIKKGW